MQCSIVAVFGVFQSSTVPDVQYGTVSLTNRVYTVQKMLTFTLRGKGIYYPNPLFIHAIRKTVRLSFFTSSTAHVVVFRCIYLDT